MVVHLEREYDLSFPDEAMEALLRGTLGGFVDEVPRIDAVGTHWVEPLVIVDVDTHGRPPRPGQEGRLRQPSFQGVRTDLIPADLEI